MPLTCKVRGHVFKFVKHLCRRTIIVNYLEGYMRYRSQTDDSKKSYFVIAFFVAYVEVVTQK